MQFEVNSIQMHWIMDVLIENTTLELSKKVILYSQNISRCNNSKQLPCYQRGVHTHLRKVRICNLQGFQMPFLIMSSNKLCCEKCMPLSLLLPTIYFENKLKLHPFTLKPLLKMIKFKHMQYRFIQRGKVCSKRSLFLLRKKYEGYFNFYRPSFNSKEPIFWGILKSFFIPISSFSLFYSPQMRFHFEVRFHW